MIFWWRSQPIHPVWLYIRDKKLDEVFVQSLREKTRSRLAILVCISYISFVVFILVNASELEKNLMMLCLLISHMVPITIIWFASKWYLAFVDLTTLFIVVCQSITLLVCLDQVD